MGEQTILKNKDQTKLKKPKMFRVILLNDDYTTMDFVVEVLVTVFHKNPIESTKIMLEVHEEGKGIVGIYTFDIARTKIAQVEEMAREREFPLRSIMEEE